MERRKKERERSRKSPFIRGGGGGEVAWRQTKIMRTFLSGKIYKIIPVLLKFKIFSPPLSRVFSLSLFLSQFSLLVALMRTVIHLYTGGRGSCSLKPTPFNNNTPEPTGQTHAHHSEKTYEN